MLKMPMPHLVPHQPWGDTTDLTEVWPERFLGAIAQRRGPSSLGRSPASSEDLGTVGYTDKSALGLGLRQATIPLGIDRKSVV